MRSDHRLDTNQPTEKVFKSPLILLLLFSTVFAFYNSNTAYTSDEVWSIKTVNLDYSSQIAALKADVHPPLYFHILSAYVALFGEKERVARSLSALFYVLSVFAVYGIGKQLFGSKTAILCAVIYLTSPLAILSSQFVRMYSLLSLLAILSTWLYLQFSLKPRDSWWLTTLYIAINGLGTFTHFAFFFIIFGQVVFHVLYFRRLRLFRLAIAVALSVVPYLLLWFPVLLRQVSNAKEGLAWVKKPGVSMLLDLFLLYGGVFWLVAPILLYIAFRRGFRPWQGWPKVGNVKYPLYLLAITILTPLGFSLFKPVFNSRLAIVGLHLFALTLGGLVGKTSNYTLPIALMVLTLILITVLHPASSPCDNRQMARYLNEVTNENDVVIFTSLTRLPIDYYFERIPNRKKLLETSFPAEIDQHPGYEGRISDPARKASLQREAQELITRIATPANVGKQVFFFHGSHPEVDSLLEQELREHAELVQPQAVHCSDSASYFKQVSVYKIVAR